MRVSVFIPARYASTRLHAKPLADICGRPMIEHIYRQAEKARLANMVTVATDDKRIFDAIKGFNGNVVMTSASHSSGTDRVTEAARDIDAEIIVNLQGDEPLIGPDMIDSAVQPMLADSSLLMATIATRLYDEEDFRNPNVVKVTVDKDGFALYFSRSPIPFSKRPFSELREKPLKHIGLYVYRKDFLLGFSRLPGSWLEEAESLEQLRALENGVKIKVTEVNKDTISVDTAEDLERVRKLIQAQA
jgi:3-deoxy-manno-octulosonate cytidylyltransferase (CMP-KDO synthetase)